jgi:hypothetical protein
MATAHYPSSNLDKLGWYLDHCNHAEWDRFSAAEREQMIGDDLAAATRVSLILGTLITTGMLLGAGTLLYVWLTL